MLAAFLHAAGQGRLGGVAVLRPGEIAHQNHADHAAFAAQYGKDRRSANAR
jgi:hypothetical protein